MAKRLIAYKKIISEEWLEKKINETRMKVIMKLQKNQLFKDLPNLQKINLKPLNYIF